MKKPRQLVCVYALLDPTTKEVKYVGATRDPIERAKKHLRGLDGMTRDWVSTLSTYPIFKFLSVVFEEEAEQEETKWIRHYVEHGNLINKWHRPSGFHACRESTFSIRYDARKAGHTIKSLAAIAGRSPEWLSLAARGYLDVPKEIRRKVYAATAVGRGCGYSFPMKRSYFCC